MRTRPNHTTLLFDFDGTLADTQDAIFNIYNRVAGEFGCLEARREDIELLRGKRPQEFLRRYRARWWKLPWLVKRIQRELAQHISDIDPVEGIGAELQRLHEAGFQLGALSSNSSDNIQAFFQNHGWAWFDFIEESHHVFRKHRLLKSVLRKRSLEPERVIFIGDETRDMEAGSRAGIKTIGVGWGFNNADVLGKANPSALIEHPSELANAICSLSQSAL